MLDSAPLSRFTTTPVILMPTGEQVYGPWVPPAFFATIDGSDIFSMVVQAQYEGRPDTLAQLIYGSPLYDWVLLAFNQVQDTLSWPRAGDTIKYPAPPVVWRSIN